MALRTRIVLLVWATSLLVVLGTLVTVYALLVNNYEALVADREEAQISRLASELSQALQQRVIALESFAPRLLDDNALKTPDELTDLLQQPSVAGDLFPDGLLVLDTNATAIAENRFVENRIGTNYADRSHFQRYLQNLEPVISEPIIGRATGLPLLSFLVPIFSETGTHLGIMGGTVDLSSTPLVRRSDEPHGADGVISIVIDPQNRLYVDVDREIDRPIPLPAPGSNALVDAAAELRPTGTMVTHRGVRYLIATEHLPDLNWIMLRALPYNDAMAPARRSLLQLLLISLGVVVLVTVIGLFFARSMTEPLEKMTRQLERMAKGERAEDAFSSRGGPEVRGLIHAMNQLTEERRRVDDMKNDFISTVSHELRTPLTSIHGSLRLLVSGATGELPADAGRMVALASRNSDRLLALIQDLLDFNKLVMGEARLQLTACALVPLARQAVEDINPMVQPDLLHFEVVGAEQAQVKGDASAIRQILDNLLSNAIKHSPDGGHVRIEIAAARPGFWGVTVSDQGPGVPESFKSRIFQRFSQAERGSARVATGTGLGLAISRELVRRMGGEIGYYNQQGAHFWFKLPRHDT